MPVYEKYTYTDGTYFCNRCDETHEGASLAEACYDECEKLGLRACSQCGNATLPAEQMDHPKDPGVAWVHIDCPAWA